MDLALDPEQEATRRAVREWVDAVVAPAAIRNDREERFPQEALDGLSGTAGSDSRSPRSTAGAAPTRSPTAW